MSSSKDYKRQIMNDLAGGNVEGIDAKATQPEKEYANFDDFANRSSRNERRELFGRGFHPDRIPTSEMEPELRKAITQIKPQERDDVARDLFKHLKGRGLSDRDLEQQLGLSTHHASRMNEDDVTKLAAFAYHNHPDIFQEVLADQPTILKFLSNPMVGAAVGAIAAKWLGKR
ncbi:MULTISPECIES: hypothetical protein [Cyanophyceae]|uniref:hypothetical protein n=1 Tax=Cyanophyceae TaxID=3028117 RepID=UPI001682C6EE|nr:MULTISPECIES: hypothetical protein [Cyanophyceae]MBD1915231.1 hypothetical protein [Phormidium sp. FACHB-77]MBD2032492.1 hypothetical protein [Phormidium sp. FACHB-322]MBD2050977.1 hypothetical protein [Leptolyngbya sp. FACHB-60]